MKIKNWKLALLSLVFFCLFIGLGGWQLKRYQNKKILFQAFAERAKQSPLKASDLIKKNQLQFYRLQIEGTFDNEHSFLLDNKTFHGQVGYEIYTPLLIKDLSYGILVDRGFVAMNQDRSKIPHIPPIKDSVNLNGILNKPPNYLALGNLYEHLQWPLRIEFVNLEKLSALLGYPLAPYILFLERQDSGIRTYQTEWQISNIPPERHLGYAVQWFALALTLLILFVALNRA